MKKQTTLMTIAMALCLFVFFSCNKSEEDGPDILNEMVVDGITYNLATGLLIDWQEQNNASADIDLALLTEGITINDEGQPENEGTMIYFDLNSYSNAGFEAGTYQFGDERGPGIITGASLVIDYNGDPQGTPAASFITDGELHITETDGTYEILFELITVDDNQVNGSFIGPLQKRTND